MDLGWSDGGLNEKQHNMILQLMAEVGLTEPHSVEVKVATSPGDNYLGCVYRLSVKGLRDKQIQEELWIVKTMPGNQARRDSFDTNIYFENEVAFYKHVIPGLSIIFKRDEPFLAVPKCLQTFCDGINDTIVLEDLRPLGFRMADRMEGLDTAHCKLVLRELARLHALSLVAKEKDPEKFTELKESVHKTLFALPRDKIVGFSKMATKSVDLIRKYFENDSKYLKKLDEFIGDDYCDTMISLSKCKDGTLSVITHGDCWTNNLLFQYSVEGKPVGVRMLDFQLSRYASLTFDIGYLICTCTTHVTRCTSYKILMDGYYSDLVTALESVGGSGELLSRSSLDIEMAERGARWGFGMALMVMTVLCWKKEEIPHMDSITSSEDGFGAIFGSENSSDQVCQARLVDLLRDLVDFNLL